MITGRHSVIEWNVARQDNEDEAVEQRRIHAASNQRQIVNEEALGLRGDPVGMKDEDVSLDRCPGHEDGNDHVERGVDEHPDAAESRAGRDWSAGAEKMDIPSHVGQFVDKPEGDHENDDVIVRRRAKRPLDEQVVEHEDRT